MRHAGVVIPVHNEVDLLPRCLHAIRVAAAAAGVDVHVVVVLDGCTDGSDDLVTATGPLGQTTDVIRIDETNVGAARAAGCELLIERYGVQGWWLVTTDAASAVGPLWLRTQLRYARADFDVVVGTITVDDWAIYGDEAERAHGMRYRKRWGHRHVHGANPGFRADAYVEVGGFAAVPTDEDVGLIAAMIAAGKRIAWAADVPVVTSSRRVGRAPGGMSWYLTALPAAQLQPAPFGPGWVSPPVHG